MFLNKKITKVALTLSLLLVSATWDYTYAAEGLFPGATVMAAPAQPTKLPEFEFANLTGSGTLKSSDMKGKVLIIRYWATW